MLHINVADLNGITLSMYDIQGRCICTHALAPEQEEVVISVKDLPEGMYMIAINGDAGTSTQQVIVAH
jgi:hypothetical protein